MKLDSYKFDALEISFQYSHDPVTTQLKQLERVLQALGNRTKYVGLLMMGAMNNDDVHMAMIKSISNSCPNLKEFYAAGLFIPSECFNAQTLRPFFGRLEKIVLQMGGFDGANTFADCKQLIEWHQEMFYGFDVNSKFLALRAINFSKVDEIDNVHLEPFLSKNPQLKSITLTRCTIDPAKHALLLKLKYLKALHLDCVGAAVGDTLTKMAETGVPLNIVGLFCCPWDSTLIKTFANFKDLRSLHLANITGLTDDCLVHLSSLIALTDLTLKFIENITMDGVIKLMSACERLSTVNLVLKKRQPSVPIGTISFLKLSKIVRKKRN